ncbi:MAG: dihydrofolate reductase family protein [Actinomycetota bacterium]|nr:dihydrofolate reductase family protein [Actinomycetota bacterium]
MADRPYTLLSCSMSLDGYLDSSTVQRLALSNDADFDRVDAVRARCDAILVGANTIRKDDPRLLVRSAARRADRLARGLTQSPTKVTVTRSGRLDVDAQFFVTGDGDKLVYCPISAAPELRQRLGSRATVVETGPDVDLERVGEDLSARGVNRLMVEGGGTINTQFLTAGLADELDLVVAPFFVGDPLAQRFVDEGRFPWSAQRRATLAEVRQIGDVVLLRYALSDRFEAA